MSYQCNIQYYENCELVAFNLASWPSISSTVKRKSQPNLALSEEAVSKIVSSEATLQLNHINQHAKGCSGDVQEISERNQD
uniref:Uncharacterized protein n=1 Tax=Oryza sativa subsp. japonica TaxID=39947 RepID=Q84Z31_ORYSJ|nr:hypothetical protein [Oryza sativa Japonica Group]BAD31315.1 hypothetical protein [Oryza sativa Japonica Group]